MDKRIKRTRGEWNLNMNELKNMLRVFFHRIHRQEVQETLLSLGVNIYEKDGELRDSYLILMETINYLKILREDNKTLEFICAIQTIIGLYYSNEFIAYFIDDIEI